ncbi:MAG: zinc ribbon domain-containing protein [Peptococcaceae bacterium]|nr:zinc ribbon domain-containing protein [Peptococcaceae bacterium]
MPTYDLVCQDCGHKFTVFCSISAKERQVCPECSSKNIAQRFTSINVSGVSGGKDCGSCSSGRSACSSCTSCG